MALYALSDTHLSLSDDKPMDIFGSRWQYYTEKLKDGFEKFVTDKDTVVIPGDISWAMSLSGALLDLKFLDGLPGKKIIGKGNHDYWWDTVGKMDAFFAENGINTVKILYNNAYEVDGFVVCGSRGWYIEPGNSPRESDFKKITAREAVRLKLSLKAAEAFDKDKERLVFLHFPPVFKDFICTDILDVLKEYGVRRCYFGHIHGVYDIPREFRHDGIKFTIISSDFLDFYPFRII